jgi:hypothetical protein
MYDSVSRMQSDVNSSKNSDVSGGKTIADRFIIATRKFSGGTPLDESDHFACLQMIYAVRNNLFHGEKKAAQMKQSGHRDRMLHYGNIIIATNESFFEVMAKHYDYRRIEPWEIEENL